MKILFLTSGPRVPSTRYRVLQWLPHLRDRGHECIVAHSRPPKYRGWRWFGNRLSEVPRIAARLADLRRFRRGTFDAVFLERELLSSSCGWLEPRFRRLAPAFVLDVDDAVFLAHPRKFARNARMATTVVCGNRFLAERVAEWNPATAELPTCLDLARYAPRGDASAGDSIVLGWTGSAANIGYLRMLEEPLRRLSRTHRIELRVIAESAAPLSGLDFGMTGVRFAPWREETEIADLHAFDVGLAPLPDEPWTRYKCGLKVLQSMAIGVPVVASPVGVHIDLVSHGRTGFLAESAGEWVDALSRLIADRELRRRVGLAGRRTVERSYSVEANVPRFEAMLAAACETATGAVP